MKTGKISATYIDHMGSDLTVVNAARVSFDKESTWEPIRDIHDCIIGYTEGVLQASDKNLIRFLARGYRSEEYEALARQFLATENIEDIEELIRTVRDKAQHWAPFAHPHIQLRITVPLHIARQLVKHQIGGVWSEVSRRYVASEPTFWFPEEWHTVPEEDIKQGAGGVHPDSAEIQKLAAEVSDVCATMYEALIDRGVAPEEARVILPLNTMTTVVWTGSLLFWARVVNQRLDGHAQLAAQEFAQLVHDIIKSLYPVSWGELVG